MLEVINGRLTLTATVGEVEAAWGAVAAGTGWLGPVDMPDDEVIRFVDVDPEAPRLEAMTPERFDERTGCWYGCAGDDTYGTHDMMAILAVQARREGGAR